ncbi:M15 family metallopeptidase [Litoreibacter albidus]|uniref:M15 family metallopeptidase n=1 Tax=Litoreibacter albidus TaxID=670155 RepID=UPI0037354544
MVATEPVETPTQQAEAAAEAQGTDDEPEQTEQECRGWIAVRSRYMNFDLIAVSFTATVYKLDGDAATQVVQETVDYTAIATNGLFVSRRRVARPVPVDGALEGAPEPAPTIISQAQIPAVAAASGKPLVMLGGDEGFEPGQFRVTLRPTVRHGKLRVHPAITASEDAARAGRYRIIGTDGVVPAELTDTNTTDEYLQVPDTTTVETDWSEDILVPCMPRNMPKTVDFRWTDFRTWDGVSSRRIRTLHPTTRHIFFAFINKIEENYRLTYRVAQAYRTFAEQDALYAQGRTTPGNIVTGAVGGRSNHNYGAAVDIYDVIAGGAIDWSGATYPDAVEVGDAFDLDWGGRWTTIVDRPHFEYLTGMTTRQLLAEYNAGNTFTYDGRTYVNF